MDKVATQFPIKNYQQFYQFYLGEHQHPLCRRWHFVGSSMGILAAGYTLKTGNMRYLGYGLVMGYACAWIGHFGFEKNKPASFKQPLYSFISDWRMWSEILRGRISL